MQTINSWCPVFSGFYNTIWEMDEMSEIDSYNQEYDTDYGYDDWEYDYQQYAQDVCKKFVEVFEEKIKEVFPAIQSIKMEGIASPKEYNFMNDSINIEVECTDAITASIIKYLNDHPKEWEDYLAKRYTSCSGFISSYPNYPEGWAECTNNYTELNSHYLGSILEFVCQVEDDLDEFDDFYYAVMEMNIYVSNYMTPKFKEKVS